MPIEFRFPPGELPFYVIGGLLVLALLAGILWRLERGRAHRLGRFVEAALAPRLLPGYDGRVRRPLGVLPVLGLAFLLFALAEPRWGESWVEVQRRSRDVLILLDTSESMNAANPAPSRLVSAKQKIQALLERAPGDRFGLIAFSGNAVLQSPLTSDHAYFLTALDTIDTDTLSEEGTNIAAALHEAQKVFEEDRGHPDAAARGERAILLVSDGEQVSGDALQAAQEVRSLAPVFVMGIGDPQGAVVEFPQWMRKARNYPVPQDKLTHLSVLDEDTLSRIAMTTDGAYVRVTANNDDVAYIAQQISNLDAAAVSQQYHYRRINRYQWPLALGILCFIAEGVWIVCMPYVRRWRMRRDHARSVGETGLA